MNLGTVLTFIGLLITSYSVFRSGRATVIETFVSKTLVSAGVLASALILAFPLVVVLHDGSVPRQIEVAAELMSFFLLASMVVYLFAVVSVARMGRLSAKRLERCAPTSVANGDWPGLLTILRRNRSSIASLLSDETLKWLFHPRFVRAMADEGEWIHLEVLAGANPEGDRRSWLSMANDVVGRVMVDGEGTLLQKALAKRFSSHETLQPSKAEEALLRRTYQDPRWYMGLRADYPLVLRAVEVLQSGTLDEEYNAATWTYTRRQGITTRWNCPVWVTSKTIFVSIEKAIQDDIEGDEYASDLLDILKEVVGRARYDREAWARGKGNWEFPTPFSFLIHEILHDLEDLWIETAKRGLFVSPPVTLAAKVRRCERLAMLWAFALSMVTREEPVGSERFRVDFARTYLDTTLQVRHAPFDLFHQDPEVDDGVLGSYRDLLLKHLIRAVKGDEEGVRIVCQAAANLDRGKGWVNAGGDWLDEQLGRLLDCKSGAELGGPGTPSRS